MPTVNRYTQLTGPRFDPLSFEQQALVPMQLRQQQDALESQAGNLGVFDINRLAVDDPLVQQTIGEYEQKVSDYVDQLQSEGFNNLSKQGLRDLARGRRELTAPTGTLGKAQGAYDAYQANKKELGKLYQAGKISADKYQRGLQQALGKYEQGEGVAGDTSFSPFAAVQDQEINKQARQIALDIQKNPRKLESLGFTARTLPDGTKRYYDTKTGREFTESGAISAGIQSLLKQNPDVVDDLTQRQQLGLIKDPNAFLEGLGQTYEALYSKDNRTVSRSGFFNPLELHNAKKAIDESNDNEGVPYVYDPVQSQKIADDSFISKLGDIGTQKTSTGLVPRLNSLGLEARQKAEQAGRVYRPQRAHYDLVRETKQANVENNLSKDEKARYESIRSKLFPEGTDVGVSESQQATAVQNYLNRYKDVQYSNPIVKPLTSSGPISSALLLNTRDLNKTNRELKNEILSGPADGEGRLKLWDDKGNPVKKSDLPDNFKVEYIGYVSPSNILPKFKNASKDQSVVPHKLQVIDENGKRQELYGSRSAYETSKPEFEAYKIIKTTTSDGILTPGLPNRYEVEKGSSLHNKGLENYSVGYDPLSKRYTVEAKLRDGRTFREQDMKPEDYESFWYNVITNTKKK